MRAYPFCTMRCTVRRLIVYTVLITLISYTGFRLTQPVSIPISNPAAKCRHREIGRCSSGEARRASRGWAHRSLKSTLQASHRSFQRKRVSMTWRNSPPHFLLHLNPPSLALPLLHPLLFSGRMIRSS